MLKVFDQNHEPVGALINYTDLSISSDLETGDKKMSFSVAGKPSVNIGCEFYLQTRRDEFVVKKISGGSYEAVMNVETLEGTPFESFSVTESSIRSAVSRAIDGTGWSVGICDIPDTDKRNAGMIDCDAMTVLQNLFKVWMAEPEFDSLNKVVNIWRHRGEDKGVYFASGFNLRNLSKESDSYDFFTRIIPKGANDLDISSVNEGRNYIDDHSYSTKVKAFVWKDESYTDARSLKNDAIQRLADVASPSVSYDADVIDLAKQSSQYSILAYGLGDDVTLIDIKTKTRDKQRIIGITEYPREPWKNTCELSGRRLRFTDLLDKRKSAESIAMYNIKDDGSLDTVRLSDIINQIKSGS